MSLFSSLCASPFETTKTNVANAIAAAIDNVLSSAGAGMLASGSLVLDKEFQPSFLDGKPKVGGRILAAAAIDELEQAEVLRTLDPAAVADPSAFQAYIEELINAVLRQFEAQSLEFKSLPAG